MKLRRHRRACFLLGACCLGLVVASTALAWTPVPAGPNTIGTLRWRKDTVPGDTKGEYIDLEWSPPPGGAPCATTAFVQTYRQWFEHDDGTIETLSHPSDVLNGLDWSQFPADAQDFFRDKQRKHRQSDDPNTTPAGHTVDSAWCDQDPYYNGDDAQDTPGKGLNGKPTSLSDRPSRDDIYFTGTRQKIVFEFEACVYCFNADGTLGQPLASVKWRWERIKGGRGVVTGPAAPSAQPSNEHKDAADLFVRRHIRTVGGVVRKFCPEVETMWNEIWELSEGLKRMDDETEEAREAVRQRIREELRKLRQFSGR